MFKKNKQGFSLVELTIYLAIFSILILSITTFLMTVLKIENQNEEINEVENQGRQIMEIISREIKNADGIVSPTIGDNSSELNLEVTDSSYDTIFRLNNDIIEISEDNNDYIFLNNEDVLVSDLDFYNLSRIDTPGIIKVEFKINKDDYEQTFYGSFSLR